MLDCCYGFGCLDIINSFPDCKLQIPFPRRISFYQSNPSAFTGNTDLAYLIPDDAGKIFSPKQLKANCFFKNHNSRPNSIPNKHFFIYFTNRQWFS